MFRNVEKNSHFHKLHYKRCSAVTEKRKANTGIGDKIADNGKVENSLYADLSCDAYRKKHSEAVFAAYSYGISFNNKKEEYYNDGKRADKTYLLADYRENKVVLRFRKIKVFLTGISQTKPE